MWRAWSLEHSREGSRSEALNGRLTKTKGGQRSKNGARALAEADEDHAKEARGTKKRRALPMQNPTSFGERKGGGGDLRMAKEREREREGKIERRGRAVDGDWTGRARAVVVAGGVGNISGGLAPLGTVDWTSRYCKYRRKSPSYSVRYPRYSGLRGARAAWAVGQPPRHKVPDGTGTGALAYE